MANPQAYSRIAQLITTGGITNESDLNTRMNNASPPLTANEKRSLKSILSAKSRGQSRSAASFQARRTIEELGEFAGGFSSLERAALDATKALTSNTDSTSKLLSVLNIAIKQINKGVNGVESLRISFNKLSIEDSPKFILALRKQQDQLINFGVTLKNLAETTNNFRNNLAILVSDQFGQQEKALTRLAAVNTKFGISVEDSTRLINSLDVGFGITGAGADEFSRKLLKFARDTGQPFNKVFQDFNGSVKDFFVELDPNKALRKFTVFQQIARRFGTDVSNLTKLTDQFETLEAGAEFGGKLNMLLSNLGGSFDAVQATLMSQPERLQYIAGQVAQVGDRIKGMSDLGQRAILRELASTLNVDVGTVRALVNRDKGQDLQRFLRGTSDLQAMGTRQQQDLANRMTSRAEIRQQKDDALINAFTVSAEKISQNTARATRDVARSAGLLLTRSKEINDLVMGSLKTAGDASTRAAAAIGGFTDKLAGYDPKVFVDVKAQITGTGEVTKTEVQKKKSAQNGVDNRAR